MKTPKRESYAFPGRYTVTEEPYQIDWSSLMEEGETVTDQNIEVVRGDTVVNQVSTDNNVTTFWLSGGSTAHQVQQIRASVTTSLGQSEAILINMTVLG